MLAGRYLECSAQLLPVKILLLNGPASIDEPERREAIHLIQAGRLNLGATSRG